MANDISVIDNIFIVTKLIDNSRLYQLHDIIDIFQYEENINLGTPKNLKIVDRFNASVELDTNIVTSISGVPFSGSYTDLYNAVLSFQNEMQAAPESQLPIDASTLSEQLVQTIAADQTNEYLRKKSIAPKLTPFLDFSTPQGGPAVVYPFDITIFRFVINGIPQIVPTVVTVANIDELIFVWNSEMPQNTLVKRSETTAFLLEGTEPVPTLVNDGIQIVGTFFNSIWHAQNFGFDLLPLPEELTSNLDCILEKIVSIDDKTSPKNIVEQFEFINPLFISFTGFKKLSFVANGAISVIRNTTIIYPQMLGNLLVAGTTFEADSSTLDTVTFDGMGKVLITVQK